MGKNGVNQSWKYNHPESYERFLPVECQQVPPTQVAPMWVLWLSRSDFWQQRRHFHHWRDTHEERNVFYHFFLNWTLRNLNYSFKVGVFNFFPLVGMLKYDITFVVLNSQTSCLNLLGYSHSYIPQLPHQCCQWGIMKKHLVSTGLDPSSSLAPCAVKENADWA